MKVFVYLMIHAMIQYKIQKNQKANSRYDSHFGNNGLNDEFVIKKLIKIIIVKDQGGIGL